MLYKLHLNENMFPHSYLVLEGMLRDLEALEGILMCSMFMLPQRAQRRARVYQRIFEEGAELHLVLEDIIIRRPQDTLMVEEVLSAAGWLPQCLTRFPDELIGTSW